MHILVVTRLMTTIATRVTSLSALPAQKKIRNAVASKIPATAIIKALVKRCKCYQPFSFGSRLTTDFTTG